MARILVIDDDRLILKALGVTLRWAGHQTIEARDGDSGVHLARREKPDLIILDVGLPDRSGFDVCRELRGLHIDTPVLMLTAADEVEDRVSGLEAGADDYMAKPVDERELTARIRALLRRAGRHEQRASVLQIDDVCVDFERRTATRKGLSLTLTKTEFALLELLAKTPGRPVSRETILGVVWGYARIPDTRTVDTHVWRLRKKIGDSGARPRWIKQVPGHGYCLASPDRDEGPQSRPAANCVLPGDV